MIPPGLVPALCRAYADLLRRQRTASAAFVRWNEPGRRAHELAWIGPGMEAVLTGGRDLRVTRDEPLHAELARLRASVELNPYERELRYGYPYVVGRLDGQTVRAPLLTVAVELEPDGTALAVSPSDDVARFNSLPFRSASSDAARDAVLARLIDGTPAFPVTREALEAFAEAVERDLGVERAAALDGTVAEPPARPEGGQGLRLVDAAAVFVAPRTGYFLASDLERIAELPEGTADATALGALLGARGREEQSETFAGSTTTAYFPFPSNPAQERVALLAERPENRVVVVQGPPGTGKSLTIANTVAHLVASGQRVLVTSQKDEALRVVDELLRRLELSQLPMTLLRQDADSKRDLRERLASLQKSRSVVETAAEQELAPARARSRARRPGDRRRRAADGAPRRARRASAPPRDGWRRRAWWPACAPACRCAGRAGGPAGARPSRPTCSASGRRPRGRRCGRRRSTCWRRPRSTASAPRAASTATACGSSRRSSGAATRRRTSASSTASRPIPTAARRCSACCRAG